MKALNPSSLPTYLPYWMSTCALRSSAVQCAVQCSAVQCSAVQYSAVQRSAVQGASPGGDIAHLAVAPYRGQTSHRLCNRAGINPVLLSRESRGAFSCKGCNARAARKRTLPPVAPPPAPATAWGAATSGSDQTSLRLCNGPEEIAVTLENRRKSLVRSTDGTQESGMSGGPQQGATRSAGVPVGGPCEGSPLGNKPDSRVRNVL